MNTTCDEMEGVSRADVEGLCVWHRDAALRGEGSTLVGRDAVSELKRKEREQGMAPLFSL